MTKTQSNDTERSIETVLPVMKERARDHIHLMFLVDDFQRALTLNLTIVEATTSRFSGKLSSDLEKDLEHKLSSDMLIIREMARHMSMRGEALIKQAEKVIGNIPCWDEV